MPDSSSSVDSGDSGGANLMFTSFLPETPPLDAAAMLRYLRDPSKYDCLIRICHPKVVQKSYGSEKRFMCPPPLVYALGGGWTTKKQQMREMYKQYLAHKSPQLPPRVQKIREDQAAELVSTIGIAQASENERKFLEFAPGKEYATRNFFVNDTRNLKIFELSVQFFFPYAHIGLFKCEPIKIIAKPSTKKQQMKNNDCKYQCLASGTTVSLFNRLRSQTALTRYLHVENGAFHASEKEWGSFEIYIVDEVSSNMVRTTVREGFIHYNNVVRLVDTINNLSLPLMRIRKVEQKRLILDESTEEEPVSQLQKCAFQMVHSPENFLCIVLDKVVIRTVSLTNDSSRPSISDRAVWTIISTETMECRFYEAMGPVRQPVAPVPIVYLTEVFYRIGPSRLELTGINLNTNVTVWLHCCPAETVVRSDERLFCIIPPIEKVAEHWDKEEDVTKSEIPISLVRPDGVVYLTRHTFNYDKNNLGATMAYNRSRHGK